MSDAFLAKITADAAPKASATTYQEKRRRATAASQARAQANQLRPFREREQEARQAGLETNLIEKELRARDEGAEVGVGLKMMLKMGYAGGERLGRHEPSRDDAADDPAPLASGSGAREAAPPAEDLDDADEVKGAHGGLGSRKRIKLDVPALAPPPTAEVEPTRTGAGGHLLEPLSISIWAGAFDPASAIFRSSPRALTPFRLFRSQGTRREGQGPRRAAHARADDNRAARHVGVPLARQRRVLREEGRGPAPERAEDGPRARRPGRQGREWRRPRNSVPILLSLTLDVPSLPPVFDPPPVADRRLDVPSATHRGPLGPALGDPANQCGRQPEPS